MFGRKTLIAILMTMATSVAALAQSPQIIEEFKDWGAYSYQTSSGKACYVLTPHKTASPLSEDGRNLDHGQNYFLLAQRISQSVSYEPQIKMSYKMKENSKVSVKVGDKSYQFYAKGTIAYLENPAQEADFVSAMRAGSSVSVQVLSSRNGKPRNYSYSLSGVTAALKKIATCQ